MSKFSKAIVLWLLALTIGGAAAAEPSSDLKTIIEAAKKEGVLNLVHGQSVVGGTSGARQIEKQMNEMFGTNISVKYAPGPAMHRQTQQLTLEYGAGQKAHSDALIGYAPSLEPAVLRGVFMKVDWAKLAPDRIRPESVESDGSLLRMGVTVPVIVYNKQRAPMVPRTLADMLRPEWKGKFATTAYVAGFPVLGAKGVWGKEKTIDFMRRFSAQVGGLIRCGAEVERVATGEYAALAMDCIAGNTITWQERGAPVDFVIPSDAAQLHYYYVAIPKNTINPNAAKLFAVFMLTEAGQKLNWDTWKIDLDGLPGSKMGALVTKLKGQGTAFTEVTMDWWLKHPEIPELEGQLIKILEKK
jgi:ABC-type Fe3+ transport system substrate-binding protein